MGIGMMRGDVWIVGSENSEMCGYGLVGCEGLGGGVG